MPSWRSCKALKVLTETPGSYAKTFSVDRTIRRVFGDFGQPPGSDAGAERAVILYSVLRTCALHDIDTYAYLIDVIDKLAAGDTPITELLPDT